MTTVVCVPLYSVGFSYRGLAPWTCALCFEVDRRTGCRYRRTGRRYRQPVDRPPVDRSRSTGRPVLVDRSTGDHFETPISRQLSPEGPRGVRRRRVGAGGWTAARKRAVRLRRATYHAPTWPAVRALRVKPHAGSGVDSANPNPNHRAQGISNAAPACMATAAPSGMWRSRSSRPGGRWSEFHRTRRCSICRPSTARARLRSTRCGGLVRSPPLGSCL